MFWIIFAATIVVIVVIAVLSTRAKDAKLKGAASGSVRVEAIKAQSVERTVEQYAKAGWMVADQTSAKSFGSQARVTITFRKP